MPNIENTRMLENFLPKMTSDVKKMKEKEKEFRQSIGNQKYDRLLKGAITIGKNALSNLKAKINDGIDEEVSLSSVEKIIKMIYDIMTEIGNFVYEGLTTRSLKNEKEETFNSVSMTITLLIVNTAIFTTFSSMLKGNVMLSFGLTAVFVAPLTEEWAKNIALSISPKLAYKYVGIFGGIEAAIYVHNLVKVGYDFSVVAFARLLAWCGHFAMLMVQHSILEKTSSKYFAYLAGVIMHATMNFLAVRKALI